MGREDLKSVDGSPLFGAAGTTYRAWTIDPPKAAFYNSWDYGLHRSQDSFSLLGMTVQAGSFTSTVVYNSCHVYVPCSLLTVLIGLPTFFLFRSWRRDRIAVRRAAAHSCQSCGYDFRATPGRCPECGTVSAAATTDAPARNPADGSG
jgi:hypothetical protein